MSEVDRPSALDVWTKRGFYIAAGYNACILVLTRFFTSDALEKVDSVAFSTVGCVGIVLWGMAYAATADVYATAPKVVAVYALEKLFYAGYWARWLSTHTGELSTLFADDPLTGLFFGSYGAGDALFMCFFGWVAWRARTQSR